MRGRLMSRAVSFHTLSCDLFVLGTTILSVAGRDEVAVLVLVWLGPGSSCPARIRYADLGVFADLRSSRLSPAQLSFLNLTTATPSRASSQRWNCMGGTWSGLAEASA